MPNRTTRLLREAILHAAELVGEDGKGRDGLTGYLVMLARNEKLIFARLLEKVLPLQVDVEDKTVKHYTAEEMVQKLRERHLPVPPELLRIASGAAAPMVAEGFEDELNGKGLEQELDAGDCG